MAKPSVELVRALRATALRLREGARYEWGHYGACNCGHLAQTLTNLTPGQLHRYAQQRGGEWRHQAEAWCDTSDQPFDLVMGQMVRAGLHVEDIAQLETLSDPTVLANLPGGPRWLSANSRDDAVLYLETWATLLEQRLQPAAPTEHQRFVGRA